MTRQAAAGVQCSVAMSQKIPGEDAKRACELQTRLRRCRHAEAIAADRVLQQLPAVWLTSDTRLGACNSSSSAVNLRDVQNPLRATVHRSRPRQCAETERSPLHMLHRLNPADCEH